MPEDDKTPVPLPMDQLLLQQVIGIASTSAEGSTAAAGAVASVRAEMETLRLELRLEINNLTKSNDKLEGTVAALVKVREEELTDKRTKQAEESKHAGTRLEIWKNTLGSIITPQTIATVLTIIGSALGLHYSLSDPPPKEIPPSISAPAPGLP